MIYALDHWMNVEKMSMVKKTLACQNIHSVYFAPKTGINDLRKMSAISYLWGIQILLENHFVGGLFIHLYIDSFFKTSLLSRIYIFFQNSLSTCFAPWHQNACHWKKWSKYWKNGLTSLGKMPTISHTWGIKFLWKHHLVGGLLAHLPIGLPK